MAKSKVAKQAVANTKKSASAKSSAATTPGESIGSGFSLKEMMSNLSSQVNLDGLCESKVVLYLIAAVAATLMMMVLYGVSSGCFTRRRSRRC